MIVDLHKLEPGTGHLSGEHDVCFVDAFDTERVVRCEVEVDYQRTGAWYLTVRVRGEYTTTCHRCLDDVKTAVEGEFELVVRRRLESDADGEGGEDYIVLPLGEHEVSLAPYIHESFVVNIPMIIQCSEDCRGLCSTCGANLNRESCGCVADTTDPRWDALRKSRTRKRGE